MKTHTLSVATLLVGAALGAAITFGLYTALSTTDDDSGMQSTTEQAKPLYWVAPMDANYKRDKPGKSPMGMDLIPVYAGDDGASDLGPGTIRISPEVINNLGVRTAVAAYQKLHSAIKTVGYVQYDEHQLVHIHPRVEGWIEKLYVKAAGDPIEQGQALYEIYSPALVNAQEEYMLALERNNERLIQGAQDRLKALQLSAAAINQLKKSREVKQTISFFAPQSGVIDNLNIREGFFVKPDTTLMSIGKLDPIWVEAEVFARQAAEVAVGLPVTMTLDYAPGREWQGQVDYIYPTLNAKTRTLKVRLRFSNDDRVLKPNMFAQVIIHAEDEQESLLVPREAVIRSGDADRVVLALDDGRFKSIEVKVGAYNAHYAEILSGLAVGEKVVSSAQFLLDSESGKSSDFKRMQPPKAQSTGEGEASHVWVEATINSLMPGQRMLNVTHEPIEAWDWPGMTMDFSVAESVDFASLKAGMTLHIEIEKSAETQYQIINVHIANASGVGRQSASSTGVINSIMAEHRMLNISREPIEKWARPAATLDFLVAEGVDLSTLSEGRVVHFTFYVADGDFIITDINQNLTSKSGMDEIPPLSATNDH